MPILRWSTEEFAEAAKGVERQRVVTELIWPIWMLSSPLSSIARFNGQCDPYTSLLCIGERGASICTTEYSDQHAGRHVQAGELRLPEIQRHYVWRGTQVRDSSTASIGAILGLDPDVGDGRADPDEELRRRAGHQCFCRSQTASRRATAPDLANCRAERRAVTVRGRKRPVKILFNLDHPEVCRPALSKRCSTIIRYA